jgi:PBSX family phage terminase large subunit
MAAAQATDPARIAQRPYTPMGSAVKVWTARDAEILVSGPAGTGKSRAILEKFYVFANKYAGFRGLFLRKTRASLTESGLVTWEAKVVPAGHPCLKGPARQFRHKYVFPNESEIVVGGLDNPDRVMSTEYDSIYVQEATECEERDWEYALTRLRSGVVPYQQLIADCNPDAPYHWLYQRCMSGKTLMLESRHEDNPAVTPQYLAILDGLTGVRYKRLRLGLWVAAEGMVYDGWDPVLHQVDEEQLRAMGVIL